MNSCTSASNWANQNFSNLYLHHKKRIQRVIQIATRLAEGKGVSLARLFDKWYDTKATYKLLKHPIMTPDIIQNTHRNLARNSIINWPGDVLAVEDSSEFEWNGHEPIEGLGPVGSGRETDQGFILHSTLALGICDKGFHQVLGLPFQQYYTRPLARKSRKKRSQCNEELETDLWRKVIKKEALPSSKKVIRVCDRGADIYEVMRETEEYGDSYIIRLKHDRISLEDENNVKSVMKDLPTMGQTKVEKRFKNATKTESIILNINWRKFSLRAPSRPGFGIGKMPPLQATVIHVCGCHESGELIEWFLYTNLEVNSIEDAIKVTQYYAKRWVIEDYHKTIKTGLKAENLQLETAHALFAAISIISVVALRLVDMRERFRMKPDAPAEESGLDQLELNTLSKYLKRDLKTVKCVVLAIGRLGGHQNRKSDGMPGVLSLWWGMSRFLNIMEGVRLTA